MGRTLTITVSSASGLLNADADEGGVSDPYVIVCFDSDFRRELCRTEIQSETTEPVWDETFEVDITKHIEAIVEETGEEPRMITFCVYDGDAEGSEPLGVAAVRFDELVKKGKVPADDAALEMLSGEGVITASVEMKKVKIGSMLKDDAALKIAGGVVGAAALGALGVYLWKRHEKKKEKLEDDEDSGLAYGASLSDDDDDDDDRGQMKKWWEMDDEDDDDEDDNKWTQY